MLSEMVLFMMVLFEEKPNSMPTELFASSWFSIFTYEQLASITCPAPGGTKPPFWFFQ